MSTLARPSVSFLLSALLASALVVWAANTAFARPALVLHLGAALASLALGIVIMVSRKGTAPHRAMGRAWVVLMSVAALSSFWLTGLRDGLSIIHVLSAWTLVAMGLAIYFIRKGNVRSHKRFMIGTFLGLAGAGIGALMPGRMLFRALFG